MPFTPSFPALPDSSWDPRLDRSTGPGPVPVSRRCLALVFVLLAALVAGGALGASAESASELRGDIPAGATVRAKLAGIADERAVVFGGLTPTKAALASVLLARETLADEQRRLAAEIEAATTALRRLAVESYIIGGDSSNLEFLASVGDASDFAWRRYLVRSHSGSSTVALERLRQLRIDADDAVLDTINAAGELRNEIAELQLQLDLIEVRADEANAILLLAEAWDRAEIAIDEGAYGIAPADKWEKLRFCESTHNYEAISPTGLYRGAYQFDIPTWHTVGGTGDPAQASPDEQDARARELYARRGDQPWTVCGRHLK